MWITTRRFARRQIKRQLLILRSITLPLWLPTRKRMAGLSVRGANAFAIPGPGGHSGPGTGGFTTKLFWDYYDFTRDEKILREHTYPAILGMSKFLSKTLKPSPDGFLLAEPSASPEQRHQGRILSD